MSTLATGLDLARCDAPSWFELVIVLSSPILFIALAVDVSDSHQEYVAAPDSETIK